MSGRDRSLAGRTAVVTGAAGGIGRAIALAFARDGAAVLVADVDLSGIEETVALAADAGGQVVGMRVDVCSETDLSAMAERAAALGGGIDVLVANAAVMVEGDILSITPADWRRALEVNATGSFLSVRAVLPGMVARGRGSIVFTASTVGYTGMRGVAAYTASKGAIVALTRQLAADYAERGVRVNAVAPGAVRTTLSQSQLKARAATDEELRALETRMLSRYPLSRWGEAEEIAEAVLYLASDRAAWTTGIVLAVDGGLTATR